MYHIIKRIFDFTSATLLLITISPLMLILAIIVRFNLGSPIFFKQERTGKSQKVFKLIKFRTMTNATDQFGNLLPDRDRVTRFGKFLRSSSMDELPELINIIKGDMSVIGPRPLPIKYNPYYKLNEMNRFNVRAGLITPDSVDDRPIISWDEQFKYEADYASNLSMMLDIKILFNVIRILLKRSTSNYGAFERNALNIERKNQIN